ncbi:MAG: thioredoxin domain-containing protein [Chloroflexi bacterium]|nr:thioredoxin domain-containing protein [Chloroflexota bacterium]MYF81811.1 thioredoxin domain-containing protein [Chloroflexota bacterium]
MIIEEAIRTGLARYEYRHFIIFGAASEFAANATECAGDQGAWWQFHDAYLLDARARSFTRAGAIDLARRHDLDVARFTQCIDDEEHRDRILQMQQQAIADGIDGTPTFRINGRPGGRSINAMLDQVRAAADAADVP